MLKTLLWNIVSDHYSYTYACANCNELNFSCGNRICYSKYIDQRFDVVLILNDNETISSDLLFSYIENILEKSECSHIHIIANNKMEFLQPESNIYFSNKVRYIDKISIGVTNIPVQMLIYKIEDISEYFIVVDNWEYKQHNIKLHDYFTSNGIALLRQSADGRERGVVTIKEYLKKKNLHFPENINPQQGPYGLTKEACRECFDFYLEYFMTYENHNFDYRWAQQMWLYTTQHGILYNDTREICHD